MTISVCHVITRMILGGAQENTLLTVRGLHGDPDFEVTLLTGPALGPEGELLEEARRFGIEPVLVDEMRRAIHPGRDLSSFHAIARHLRERDYDIVHTHSSKAGVLGRWAARSEGVPWIVHTIHGLPFHDYQPIWKHLLFRGIERATGSITHRIQTVCDRMAEKARRAGIHPIDGFETVYSGMELAPFLEVPEAESEAARTRKREWGLDPDRFVIGKIARLFHLKGHRYLLEAFRRLVGKHPDLQLMLVGDGVLKSELQQRARELGIRENTRFVGLIPYQRIPSALGAMDCLVHTSLREGLARVIPQAQAAGRPVVSYDVDGAPEAIDHGRTGFLVPPKSVRELVDYLSQIVDQHDLRRRFSRAGRRWVTPRFEWRHMVKQIKRSYRRMIPSASTDTRGGSSSTDPGDSRRVATPDRQDENQPSHETGSFTA